MGLFLIAYLSNMLCYLTSFFAFLYLQGVLKVRKRVTLSVIAVSVIFGICWISGLFIYVLSYYDIYMFGSASYAIADTMFMFNSAVNPFVYSLLNERFREKLKGMICCTSASACRTQDESYSIELPNNAPHAHHNAAAACSSSSISINQSSSSIS